MHSSNRAKLILAIALTAGITGCASKAGNGALIGGGVGALAGGIIGNQSHGHAAGGAVIGGLVGAGAGALIGNEMDKSDQRERDRDRDRVYQTRTDTAPRIASESRPVLKEDVIVWTDKGMSDEVIIDRIQRNHARFYLTGADENQLRDAGVSEEVIRTMRDTTR